jgi:hypothetical protein
MKKTIFTLSFAFMFVMASNAQDKTMPNDKKDGKGTETSPKKAEPANAQAVNADGTVASPAPNETGKKEEAAPNKKVKTRMAINEKGMPGNAAKKEEKKEPAKKD